MARETSLPVAQRRTRRRTGAPEQDVAPESAHSQTPKTSKRPSSCLAESSTPAKKTNTKKRVRFSDPGPIHDQPDSPQPSSTGLTPMIRRTSLAPPAKKQRRRHSTPAQPGSGSGLLARGDPFDTAGEAPFSGEVSFLPLRQVLDGRVKRRIRRNGLSEEMNAIHADKKRRRREAKAEVEALRAQVAAKDAEIQRLHEETVCQDMGRIVELEGQIQELRRELASKADMTTQTNLDGDGDGDGDGTTNYDWTLAARDPFSDDFVDMNMEANNDGDDDDFGEATMADLACSTPSRRASARAAERAPEEPTWLTPPSTSPAPPTTPRTQLMTPSSHAGVQVDMPDPEKKMLEDELTSLRREIAKLTGTLENYSSLTSRMAGKLEPFEKGASFSSQQEEEKNLDLETCLSNLLQTVSDRTAALFELNSSLSALGFPGHDASDIISSLAAAFRAARLELEYVTPGEISLPLTSAGAAVLDLLLARLRELARRCRESDDEIDEYHALELSLRQQLGARVDAMDGMAREIDALEAAARDKDARIAELDVGLERLKGASASYARDMRELEALVEGMDAELAEARAQRDRARAGHEADMAEWEGVLAERDGAVAALEARLAEAAARCASLADQVAALQAGQEALQAEHAALQLEHEALRAGHREELAALNREHGAALALRDARVAELRGEVGRADAALRAADDAVRGLRVENADLRAQVRREKGRARDAMDSVRTELERVVKMSQELLAPAPKEEAVEGEDGPGQYSEQGSAAAEEDDDDEEVLVVKPGTYLAGGRARRASDGVAAGPGTVSKKRRRYDSGLGFLDEDEVDVL